jgi:hypothetical protein
LYGITQLVNARIKVIKTFSLSHFRFSSDEERYYILTAYIGLLLEVAFISVVAVVRLGK